MTFTAQHRHTDRKMMMLGYCHTNGSHAPRFIGHTASETLTIYEQQAFDDVDLCLPQMDSPTRLKRRGLSACGGRHLIVVEMALIILELDLIARRQERKSAGRCCSKVVSLCGTYRGRHQLESLSLPQTRSPMQPTSATLGS